MLRGNPRHSINEMTYMTLPIDAGPEDPVSECFFYPGSKELLAKLPGFPQPLMQPESPTFRMTAVPGKGMALFSLRALTTGDLILSERPLLVAARTVNMGMNSAFEEDRDDEMEKHLTVAVNRMRPEDKADFMSLKRGKTHPPSRPVLGIIRMNGFGTRGLHPGIVGYLDSYPGVCRILSKVTHSCSPNSFWWFDPLSFSYRHFAVRDIAEGEELTLSCCLIVCSKAERQKLIDEYHFVCTCPSCADSAASDPRRAIIKKFLVCAVAQWAVDRTLPDSYMLVECQKLLALTVREGLESVPHHWDALTAMMEAYICLGDAQNASEWAAKVDKFSWNEDIPDVKALIDPASSAYQKHPMWRKRVVWQK
ncbi:hypothetical protein C8R46DRAFT_28977 [Mycena filopes]|nr:hypothetical protein C8R46DRAFT_28977 [Mycena filopes]